MFGRLYYKLLINRSPAFNRSFLERLPIYTIKKEDFKYIESSTYAVAKVKIDSEIYFFKEMFYQRNKKDFVGYLIEDFLENNEEFISSAQYLISITDNGGINRFFQMGLINDKHSNVYNYFKNNDPTLIGYDKCNCDEHLLALNKFVSFCWGSVSTYSMFRRKILTGVRYNNYHADRAIAHKIVDSFFGTDVLVDTRLVRLVVNDKIKLGVLTNFAFGKNPNDFSRKELKQSISPILQKQLNNLNIIDAICLEKDHGPNNYNVSIGTNGQVEKIFCFDNDSSFSFYPIPSCKFFTYSRTSPIIDKRGYFNRKYIDKVVFDKIYNMHIKDLLVMLKPYLNFYQRLCIKLRIDQLKKAILKSLKQKNLLLLSEKDWDNKTIDFELNKAKYDSYLRLYSNWLG